MTADLFGSPSIAPALQTGAVFSPCRRWRYHLHRRWADGPAAVFLGMNPSTADEKINDATIERFYRRIRAWEREGLFERMGFYRPAAVEVVNVFAWRETDSRLLPGLIAAGTDIVGPENDGAIVSACAQASVVVCGWGLPGHRLLNRGPAVLQLLWRAGVTPYCLGINADGSPQHPLYIGYDRPLSPYAGLPA